MPKKNVKVEIPENPTELLKLAKKISDKHIADAANSPLKGMVDFNWSITQPLIAPAQSNDEQAAALRAKAEEFIGERNKNIPAIEGSIKATRDVLLGLNKKNPKVLGQWGFTVSESVSATPKRKAKPSA
jgi:2-succinyl-5-enolpyruvyl-6-hydroxy-3-cyclohexene-1-carboxylate synthase